MMRGALLALAAIAVAALLAGCSGTHQDGSSPQNGSGSLGSSSSSQEGSNLQRQSEAANANLVGRCAGNVSTPRQQEGRGEDSNDTKIAFTRAIAGDPYESELYVMNADGSNES